MNDFFEFEADFVDSLRCIPMQVRMKLDTCGVKLKLSHWHQFNQQERQALVSRPCTTLEEARIYREFLQKLVLEKTSAPAAEFLVEPNPAWLDAATIPLNTLEKASDLGVTIALEKWAALTPPQRFALIKLSRPSHESKNFLSALKEFKLA